MDTFTESTDRNSVDYFLFGLGFVAFLLGVGGVIVSSVAAAVAGGALLLLVIGLS